MRYAIAKNIFNALKCCALSALMGALAACASPRYATDKTHRWVVYYDQKEQPEAFDRYDVVVLDSTVHPDVAAVKAQSGMVLGYVSVAEVDASHDPADAPAVLIEKNPNWNSHLVDIRQPEWYNYILEQKVPGVLAKGFDGVMLDTIDSALYLEAKDPVRYAGMREAAIYIVQALRHRYPDMPIMVNRGVDIWNDIAPSVNMLLAESTYTHFDLAAKKASLQPSDVYRQYLEKLKEAKAYNRKLRVYTLDYWDMNDTKGIVRIYETQRSHGFTPYVTTPDLRIIHHEVKASIIAPTGEEGICYA